MKLFLIVGLQRTGTTLLASMLGRHPEINMLFETTNNNVFNLIGKDWNGNKLLAYRQIRIKQRASKWGFLINRIANLDFKKKNKHQLVRPYPTSHLSIQDYKDKKAIFITIERDEKTTINSMMKRSGQNYKQAKYEYEKGMDIINTIKKDKAHTITFLNLINNPEKTLKKICSLLEIKYQPQMLEGPKYNFVYPNKKIVKKKS